MTEKAAKTKGLHCGIHRKGGQEEGTGITEATCCTESKEAQGMRKGHQPFHKEVPAISEDPDGGLHAHARAKPQIELGSLPTLWGPARGRRTDGHRVSRENRSRMLRTWLPSFSRPTVVKD